jgi:hypothetical protein
VRAVAGGGGASPDFKEGKIEMDEYQIDIPANKILEWVREDASRRAPQLLVRAAKEYRVETDFDREVAGIGDDEDVSLITAVGTMTIAPLRGRRGWVLRMKSEDGIGIRPSREEGDFEDDDDMTLDAFVDQFLTPRRRDVEVSVMADDGNAWRRFQRWLARRRAGAKRK